MRKRRRTLEGYGWVDQPGGVARIPIEEAKKLLFERGLPVAPERRRIRSKARTRRAMRRIVVGRTQAIAASADRRAAPGASGARRTIRSKPAARQ